MFRDYTNYEVLPDGRIWSKVRKKFLNPETVRGGYQRVVLTDNNGKKHHQLVHRVTWIAIKGEIQEGYELNHLDENKCNNAIWNLELCTHKENNNWGTRNSRAAAAQSKRVGAFKNGEIVMVFPSTAAANRNGYCSSAVSECCRNCFNREGNNVYKGFTWRYLEGEEN